MTAAAEAEPSLLVPLKCASAHAAGSPANPCTEPGSQRKCTLCPLSPTYWRLTAQAAKENS